MINEKFWSQDIWKFEIPKFHCPMCHTGILISEKEKTIEETTKQSAHYYNIIGEPECYEGYFTVFSYCNNPDCREITIIAGDTKIVQSGFDDGIDPDSREFIQQPGPVYDTIYLVKYTNPSIQIITIPSSTPSKIVDVLNASFRLFWIDEDSCGNKIRNCIEKLLDIKGVKKTTIAKNRKRQYLDLHHRIEIFRSKEPEIAEYLLALKWIGNQGSHTGKYQLTRKELIDAYKILENSLAAMYNKEGASVRKLVKKINKSKKHKVR